MLSIDLLKSMAHNHVHDYVIPGLTSSLVGGNGHGLVRMFSQEREHEEPITPHSHRFDFQCLVLQGSVRNRIWYEDKQGDLYQRSTLEHFGQFGDQQRKASTKISRYSYREVTYHDNQTYLMLAEQIHSIFFSRGAVVLFFEGPSKSNFSETLEPVSGGRVIPTFRVDPWMFRKDV